MRRIARREGRSDSDGGIEAITERGAVRIEIHDEMRALSLQRGPEATAMIALVVPKELLSLPVHEGLTALGPDQGAIRPEDRGDHRFDLGLGRPSARFTVRLRSATLRASLEAAEGAPLTALLASQGAALLAESPTRVVETAVGRVEVVVPIPLPGGRSLSGPHTHLLPAHLATKRQTAPGLDVPDAYAIGALFHPLGSRMSGPASYDLSIVVHSAPSEEAEVAEALAVQGEPNGRA